MILLLSLMLVVIAQCTPQSIYTNVMNFRVGAGERTCFFESGKAGQLMEVIYQVVDGQHGDLDISLEIIDPDGARILSDYKKPQNSIIKDLTVDGDYAFCLDNSFSSFNSKLVYVYVMMEDQEAATESDPDEAVVSVIDQNGAEVKQVQTMHWTGFYENGAPYYVEVEKMADSLSRTLRHVVKARHMLDLYGVNKSRDSYLAFEETFVVDVWSGFQISLMFIVGILQVYMIKKLFKGPSY